MRCSRRTVDKARWARAPGEWWAGGGPRLAPSSSRDCRPRRAGGSADLSGTVYGDDGRTALSGVTVYVYQTDVRGLYNREGRFGVPHRIRGLGQHR